MTDKKEIKKISLWELSEEFEILEELLIESGGEITEDHQELIEHVEMLLKTKADGVVGFINKQKDLMKIASEKIKDLQEFKKAREKSIDSFSNYIIQCMNKLEMEKIQGDFNKISIRKPTKIVSIDDESEIPPAFIQVIPATVSIDKNAIKKALKTGEYVNGASLADGKKSLNISKRTK